MIKVGVLDTLLPDETLFSWHSRFDWVSGGKANKIIYMRSDRKCFHDLPSNLDHFISVTQNAFGDAQFIIQTSTILPTLIAFRSRVECADIIEKVCADATPHLKSTLGLYATRFGANHPLKACPQCLMEDKSVFGIAYWHRSHQLPGVWICPTHQLALLEACYRPKHQGRSYYLLPAQATLGPPLHSDGSPSSLPLDSSQIKKLAIFAIASCGVTIGTPVSPHDCARAYRSSLIEKGFVSSSGHLQLQAAAKKYVDHCQQLRVIPELANLAQTQPQGIAALRSLVNLNKVVRHPLHHLVLASLLFEDWDSFILATKEECGKTVGPLVTKELETASPPVSRELLDSIIAGRLSPTNVARQLDIDVHTIEFHLSKLGFRLKRRPKKLNGYLRQELIDRLNQGADKATLAAEYHISEVSITRILRTEPGLQDRWHQVRLELARENARSIWSKSRADFPDLGTNHLRQLVSKEYAWLYRNDRRWLIENSPVSKPLAPIGRICWDDRDRNLASNIKKAAVAISLEFREKKRISLQDLCQNLPELRKSLSHLHQLPLSRAAIANIRKLNQSTYPSLFED